MFDLHDHWVWDFWLADDGKQFHLFFLKAPRSLGDPDLRHAHARIGHAVSDDLTTWQSAAIELPSPVTGGWDSQARWTGCVVQDGVQWRMFSTGCTSSQEGFVQSIAAEVSQDQVHWVPAPGGWPLEADERFYLKASPDHPHEAWRDPWVVRDGAGLWHLYVTADTNRPLAPGEGVGVIAHATSPDLTTWEVGPPLGDPHTFSHIETMQTALVEGRWVLIFSCHYREIVGAQVGDGGVWSVPIDGPGAPVDLSSAVRMTDDCLYVGRVVEDRFGTWQFLAFVNRGADGEFVGGLIDPVEVRWRSDGRGLELARQPLPWCAGPKVG